MEMNTSNSPKSFWKRPEGVTGYIVTTGLIIGGGYLAYTFLPYIVSILKNAVYATIFFVILAALLYLIFDPKIRNLIWFMYKSFLRWITGLFIQIDPIGILESYIESLYKNLQEMDAHITKLKGQMTKIKTIITTNEREMEENLRLAEQAKKQGNMDVVTISTRQYGRLEASNKRFQELLAKMEILYRVLSKMHKNSGYLIKDIENEVRIKKQEREAIRAGYGAMKRAMNIIKGDPDKKQMFDQAMDAIVEDVSNKVGEMERFMEVSSTFIESIDLQNGVYEQKGLELLEKMESQGISMLLKGGERDDDDMVKIEAKNTNANSENKSADNNYNQLF